MLRSQGVIIHGCMSFFLEFSHQKLMYLYPIFFRKSFCLVLRFNFSGSFWFLWCTVHLFKYYLYECVFSKSTPLQNWGLIALCGFGAPDTSDTPDTSYWAHAWFELPRDRAAVPDVRGLNLKEPNSVRDRFLQHLFNPSRKSLPLPAVRRKLAGDNTAFCICSIYIYYRIFCRWSEKNFNICWLHLNTVCLSFFVNTCR